MLHRETVPHSQLSEHHVWFDVCQSDVILASSQS